MTMSRVLQQLPHRAARSIGCAARYKSLCHPRQPSPAIRPIALHQQHRQRSDDSSTRPAEDQAIPLSGYYAELLSQPLPKTNPLNAATATATPAPKTEDEERIERARVVFGSRLAGPGERKRELDAASHTIAGILVPPRPTEPDNCCMSGCVNCVWDMFRDELEEWAAKSAKARGRLQEQRGKGLGSGMMLEGQGTPSHVATSMDDDGGGSETNWNDGGGAGKEEDLFGGIPVGIREFMRTEKALKARHAAEKSMD